MTQPIELLRGCWLMPLKRLVDARGAFVKTFARANFEQVLGTFEFKEEFYSQSKSGVIRGMHFQAPPADHTKLVFCAMGSALDVLLDLRKGPDYGKVASVTLSGEAPNLLAIPPGIAHGFRALSDETILVYKTSCEYAPQHDAGIRWDSFGFDWGADAPILSERDLAHPSLSDFISPF